MILCQQVTVALGTLAANTALKIDTGKSTYGEDFRMTRAELAVSVDGFVANELEKLQFGLANGELTVTEIGECLTVDGPTGANDRVGAERAERFVNIYSMLTPSVTATQEWFRNPSGGPIIVVKPNWTFNDSQVWEWFVYNDAAAVATTGATVRLLATIYGVWVI